MPNVAVGNIIQVTVGYLVHQQRCLMVRNYRVAYLPAAPDLNDVYNDFDNWFSAVGTGPIAAMRDCLNVSSKIDFVNYQLVAPARYFPDKNLIDLDGLRDSGEALPANIGATAGFQTERAGRGRQGSVHLSGIGKNDLDAAGFLVNAYITLFQVLMNRLDAPFGGTGPNFYYTPVTFNPALDPNYNPIIDHFMQTSARVMRRRTVGVGI